MDQKYGPIQIYKQRKIIKYKEVLYHNWLNSVELMILEKSGIIRRSKEFPTFKETDIEDYDKAFDTNKGKGFFQGIHIYSDLPAAIPPYHKSIVTVFYPKACMHTTLGEVLENKKTDPLAYDFISWYKAAFKESVLTFDDICLLTIIDIGLYDQSRFNLFKNVFTRDIPSFIDRIGPTYHFLKKYASGVVPKMVDNIIETLDSLSRNITMINDANKLIKRKMEADDAGTENNPDTSAKKLLRKMGGPWDYQIYQMYKYKEISNLFVELKKNLKQDEIQIMALGLYIKEIVHCSTTLEFVFKFLQSHGSLTGPMMIIPFICRSAFDVQIIPHRIPYIGGFLAELKLWKNQSRWLPKKMLKDMIEERQMLTRPKRKSRSRKAGRNNKTRKN
jgi:hypothetical protein